jgi:hypothetical protein
MNRKISILETLQKYIAAQENFPVLNPDAAKLQDAVLKPDPDMGVVKKLIQTDPTLTTEILKVANSAYYKGLGEVLTIKEAALRLGRNELVDIIMQVIHKKKFFLGYPGHPCSPGKAVGSFPGLCVCLPVAGPSPEDGGSGVQGLYCRSAP